MNFQLRFKIGVQAPPALQAELALQNTEELNNHHSRAKQAEK